MRNTWIMSSALLAVLVASLASAEEPQPKEPSTKDSTKEPSTKEPSTKESSAKESLAQKPSADSSSKDPYIGFEHNWKNGFGVRVLKDPRGKPVKKQLTFDTSGQTNGILVRIDGKDVEFGTTDSGKWIEQGDDDQNPSKSVWALGKVHVTQVLHIKPGKTGKLDTLFVRYDLENKDDRPHAAGIRVVIDSCIGTQENDGVPFRYAGGSALITTCKDFPEGSVPEWVEALEKPNEKDPGTILVLTLKVGDGLEAPGRASVTLWPGAAPGTWEIPVESFSPEGGRKDSSLVMYWMPKELKPGQKRSLGYAFGSQDVPSNQLPKTKPAVAKSNPPPSPSKQKQEPGPPATLKVASAGNGKAPLSAKLSPAVELILDCSYSMSEQVDGKPKIDIARRVLVDLADNLSTDIQVGLRLYGHAGFWHKDKEKDPKLPYPPRNDDPRWNTDSELVAAIGPLGSEQRKRLRSWLDWADARGKTPLCYSLLEAKKDFPAACASKTVVLLSDGMETCGGSLDEVAKAYAGSDVGVVIQVVGFDIDDAKVRQQLEKIAQSGGGKYYDARDAKKLVDVLRQAVPNTGVEVLAADSDKVLASGSINGKPLELPAGSYRVRLAGSKAAPISVRLVSGQLMQLNLSESGQLTVAGKSQP